MTAIRARRTRVTVAAFAAGIVGVGAVGGLGYAGVETLADSRAGRVISGDADQLVQRLPYTPTALVATVDNDDRLTSVAVLTIEPDGTGGSIVNVSPNADAASGTLPSLQPLNAVYRVDGPEAFLSAAESVTGLSFDVVEIVEAERFAELVTPLGELTARLPTELRDASSGTAWPAGVAPMSPANAAEAVTASDPRIADWYFDPARAAVWDAVADRVGAGIGSAEPVAGERLPRPATLDEFTARLFADRVDHRTLTTKPISDERVAEELAVEYATAFADAVVAVVAHDRAEVVLVLGAVAPGRMGAPLEAPTFRVLSRFEPDDLEPLGMNNADVARLAINRLLFTKVNVVSFGQPESVPERTLIEVADASTIPAVEAAFGEVFGEADVRQAATVIEGVDVQITLGRSFLDTLDPAPPASAASTVPAATAPGTTALALDSGTTPDETDASDDDET